MIDREHAQMMLTLARSDLTVLDVSRDMPRITTAVFGFHAQQAVEKALKAWLTIAGGSYPKIHDLEELFELLREHRQAIPERFLRLEYLTDFATQFRYVLSEDLVVDIDRPALFRDVAEVIDHVARLILHNKPAP